MRISDWSSDVCSSDLLDYCQRLRAELEARSPGRPAVLAGDPAWLIVEKILAEDEVLAHDWQVDGTSGYDYMNQVGAVLHDAQARSEEHTSELQSLMRSSYAVFCLTKKNVGQRKGTGIRHNYRNNNEIRSLYYETIK